MEKLKRYNQFLLAIGGTFLLLFMIVGGVSILVEFMNLRYNKYEVADTRILSDDKTKELVKDSLRKQLISFNTLNLVDTVSGDYIIPVEQATLQHTETFSTTDHRILGLSNDFRRMPKHHGAFKTHSYSNIVVYNEKSKTSKEVFKDRISISGYRVLEENDNYILAITATIKDSNNDGYIDDNDLESLFLYKLKDRKLIHCNTENKDFLDLEKLYETERFIVLLGVDKNQNGKFEVGKEPKFFYNLDISSGATDLLIDSTVMIRLQQRLDGSLSSQSGN